MAVLEHLRRDVAFAVRVLKQSPGYTGAAVLSLALGIGANTAIFSILNSLVLKSLPVRGAHELIAIASDDGGEDAALTYPIWREVRDRRLVRKSFVWASDRLTLHEGVERKGVDATWVDGTFFDVLGVPAFAGRVLTPADDRRSGGPDGPVAVLSYSFWTTRFARDASAIGQTLNLHGVTFRIVGVTPPDFFGLDVGKSFDVILPLETEPLLARVPSRVTSAAWPWLHISGRLAEHETIDTVAARIRSAQPRIREATMPPYSKAELRDAYLKKSWTLRHAGTGSSRLRTRYASALLTLLAIVGAVLLIACANLANLQLARTSARRYEFSVRSALGASKVRILQQQLVESLVLAACGAVAGYLLAQSGSRIIVAQLANWATTPFLDLSPDWRVFAATSIVTVLTTVLFATAPAVRAAAADPIDALKDSGAGAGRQRRSLGASLVVIQVALSVVLVLGAGLFLRSFARLAYRDLGFDRDRVLVAVVEMGRRRAIDKPVLFEQVRQAVAALPGVEGAALSMATPLGNAGLRLTRDVTLPQTSATAPHVFTVPVSPGWFRTYGTSLMAGRDFSADDARNGARVAIVNETFVRRYLRFSAPIGLHVMATSAGDEREPVEIVGVVKDAAFTSVREAVEPMMYRPFAQLTDAELLAALGALSVSIRPVPGMRPEQLRAAVSAAVERVDPNLTISFLPLSTYLDAYYTRERLLALLSGFFGVLAVLLASVGLYGVTAYFVSQRAREIAVRMALGARAHRLVLLVVARFAVLTTAGVAAGLMLGWWAARLVRVLLYSIDAHDAATYGAVSVIMLLVGVTASWIPARRAAKVNPAALLRL